jgi:cell division protein FtsN
MEHHDDSSHYEVSLTGGQALIAFVLLLFSLGASFAFGVVVGKGRTDERLVVRQETPVIAEAGAANAQSSRIVELGAADRQPEPPARKREKAPSVAPAVIEEVPPRLTEIAPPDADQPPPAQAESGSTPFFAQILSTSEATRAEAVAAKLIDSGFTTAFVDRASTGQGTVYRVRVRYPHEAAARAAAEQLKPFAPGDVWVTSRQ